MSKKKIEIGLGEIPTEEEAKGTVHKAEKPGVSKDEVEGHERYWETVICPDCGSPNVILADTHQRLLWQCAYASCTFIY